MLITRAELSAGAEAEHNVVLRLLGVLREIAVEREIAELAGRLRRQTRVLLPDAPMAATAIVHQLELKTSTSWRFGVVGGMRLA